MPTTPKGKATPIGFSRRSMRGLKRLVPAPEGLLRYRVGKGIGDQFPNRELGIKMAPRRSASLCFDKVLMERLAALNNTYGVDSAKDCVHALDWHIRFTLDDQWL